METWEKEYREQLEKEIPHRCYYIGDTFATGKYGYIEFLVAVKKNTMGAEGAIRNAESGVNTNVGTPTLKDFTDFIEVLRKNADEKTT